MPLLPAQPLPVPPPWGDALPERFLALATIWHEKTDHLSSMSAASRHSAYRDIIALGPGVIPLLLHDLQQNETHWFDALKQLTHADPVPAAAAGNIPKMAEAWLQWAKDQGYQW